MITFYYASGSPFAWRAWLALEYKSLPYDLKSMSFFDGDLKTPEYLRINPRGKVPSIVDDGFSLYESAAILEYLDEQYPDNGSPLFPGSSRNRAHIRRLVNEADFYLDQANRKILLQILFTPKENWDDEQIANGIPVLRGAEIETGDGGIREGDQQTHQGCHREAHEAVGGLGLGFGADLQQGVGAHDGVPRR